MRRYIAALLLTAACTGDIDVYKGSHKGSDITVEVNRKTRFTKVRVDIGGGIELYGEDDIGDGRYEKIVRYKSGKPTHQYPVTSEVPMNGTRGDHIGITLAFTIDLNESKEYVMKK